MAPIRIFVPRLMDANNRNAQNLNARALLARFRDARAQWQALRHAVPDPAVAANSNVRLRRLWWLRLWAWQVAWEYSRECDAIFYPGPEWFDERGLQRRQRRGTRAKVIATLEALLGDERRESQLSEVAGRPVFCHRVAAETVARMDSLLNGADHIIAISPFLAKMGKTLYGDKVITLPLGIEAATFHAKGRQTGDTPTVVGVGTLAPGKRPEVFIELARQNPDANFIWCGSGALLNTLREQSGAAGVENLLFPGSVAPADLADLLRRADLFVLPSRAEGAPRVIQEAAACGVPVVAFGFYESPAVRHGENGIVVWNDRELSDAIAALLADPQRRSAMGERGAQMALEWDWDRIASQWESCILNLLTR